MIHDLRTLAGIMAAAADLQETANKMGLEFWFDIDFHFMTLSASITNGIGPGRLKIWTGAVITKLSDGIIEEKMKEAAEVLAMYRDDQTLTLEMEVDDLKEKLKNKQAALRQAKKEGAK